MRVTNGRILDFYCVNLLILHGKKLNLKEFLALALFFD